MSKIYGLMAIQKDQTFKLCAVSADLQQLGITMGQLAFQCKEGGEPITLFTTELSPINSTTVVVHDKSTQQKPKENNGSAFKGPQFNRIFNERPFQN